MSFFDKLKTGVSEAGNKAKSAVEVNRLKLQNHGKQREIEQQYMEIGRAVFEAMKQRESINTDALQPSYDQIIKLQEEIQQNQMQIAAISDEKQCACGQLVPIQAKFCPACGQHFAKVKVIEEIGPDNNSSFNNQQQ